MPAAALDGNSWEVESSKILKKIGFNEVSEEDIRAAQDAWKGVLHRPGAKSLNEMGYTNVFSLKGGISDWISAGFETEE